MLFFQRRHLHCVLFQIPACSDVGASLESWLYFRYIHVFMLPLLQKNKDPRVLYTPSSDEQSLSL